MKFVWITPTYRVNIESIFSLQQESERQNPDWIVWHQQYDEYLQTIQKELPPLEIDNKIFDPKEENNSDEETIQKYAIALKEKIIESLGQEPSEFIHDYIIITHTGMKINISKDKYELINTIIDNEQNKKEKS